MREERIARGCARVTGRRARTPPPSLIGTSPPFEALLGPLAGNNPGKGREKGRRRNLRGGDAGGAGRYPRRARWKGLAASRSEGESGGEGAPWGTACANRRGVQGGGCSSEGIRQTKRAHHLTTAAAPPPPLFQAAVNVRNWPDGGTATHTVGGVVIPAKRCAQPARRSTELRELAGQISQSQRRSRVIHLCATAGSATQLSAGRV